MTAAAEPGMFAATAETRATLSERFAAPDWRAAPDRKPTWAQIKEPAASAMCDECAQRQHETRGASGHRMQPRHRRSFPKKAGGGPALKLCARHAQSWRDRDAEDTKAER